jgi:hypothetical protein
MGKILTAQDFLTLNSFVTSNVGGPQAPEAPGRVSS